MRKPVGLELLGHRVVTPYRRSDSQPSQTVPMKFHEALAWLVEFATTDLDKVKAGPPGDILNLVFGLRRYLGGVDDKNPLARELRAATEVPEVLQSGIETARRLVEGVADRTVVEEHYFGGRLRVDTAGARPVVYLTSLRDAVLLQAADDLSHAEDTWRVRRCKWGKCHRIFFAKRPNQTYCGPSCANLAAAQAYRERHGEERKRKARRNYEQKMRAKYGPNVRIGRRARRPRR